LPSEKILENKKRMVEDISEKLKDAAAIILVDYKGINVSNDTALRSEMRESGVEYFVAKNSIMKYVCESIGLEEFIPSLEGTTSIAVSKDDAIAPARIIQKYTDKLRGKGIFKSKIGYIDGKYADPDQIRVIAKLPSREVLVAQVAGSLNGIIASLARAISEVANKQSA